MPNEKKTPKKAQKAQSPKAEAAECPDKGCSCEKPAKTSSKSVRSAW